MATDGLSLDAEQFDRLAAYGQREEVAVGQILYRTGDRRYDLFLVGTACVDVILDATMSEPERVVYSRHSGDFTGELSMLTGQSVFLTARVRTPGTVVRIQADGFRAALSEQPDIADIVISAFDARRKIILQSANSVLEIVGIRNCAEGRALRTYASRLQLPHSALEAGSIPGQAFMAAHGLTDADLPAVVVSGRVLRRATPGDLAAAIGLSYDAGMHDVDLVVVGAGPAGLAAAVYAASEGLVTVLFDAYGVGGQAATSSRIENYLGFPRGVSGEELTRLALVQALRFGAHVYAPCDVADVDLTDPSVLTFTLGDGSRIRSRAAIVATGARYRRLKVDRLEEFERLGQIRYSATELDARDCASQPITIIGAANSAGQAAMFLASKGCRVDVLVRGEGIERSMSAYLARRLQAHSMVTVWPLTQVAELLGDESLEGVVVRDASGRDTSRETKTIFCFIGAQPDTGWLSELARDENGFVLTDTRLPAAGSGAASGRDVLPFQTSDRRVFAVGDVRAGSMKRVASAVGEGASAVSSVHTMLATEGQAGRATSS